MPVEFDRTAPAFRADPYPTLARFQRDAPILQAALPDGRRVWYALRYQDVAQLLHDPRASASKFPPELLEAVLADSTSPMNRLARVAGASLLALDPPEHTRIRNLVKRAFTPRRVEGLRSRIGALVEKRLDELAEREHGELIADLAVPLPLDVIAELLGLPAEDRGRLKRWSDALATVIDGSIRDANLGDSIRAATELGEYLDTVVDDRRHTPRDDLISDLVRAHIDRDALSHDELVATAGLILGAGHETTTNLIGNGLLTLLRHPEELARVRRSPELLPGAVEEVLRFEPPVQLTSRTVTEDVLLHGVRIPAGEEVNLYLAAANRDPDVFDHARTFDPARRENRHLSFGHGAHFCLGAALARLEGQLAIGGVLRCFPQLALESERVAWRAGNVLRGLESLPVRLGERAR